MLFNERNQEMNASQLTDALRRFDHTQGPRKVGPEEGHYAELGGCDARFLVWTEESGGGFSLVEHPIELAHYAAELPTLHLGVEHP